MRIGSLFSGIGGLELGLELAGLGNVVWQVEQSSFCRDVLAKHWPVAIRYEDVCNVGKDNLEPVDLICGGFPCQDVSSAGKGAGLAGSRSGLWYQFARIVGEMRPEWAVVENVASGAKLWVDEVVRGLEQLGYETLPIPLSAFDVGAPHLRRRVFIVAHAGGEQVRKQPGWRRGQDRGSPPLAGLAGLAGEDGSTGHSHSHSQPAKSVDGEVAGVQTTTGSGGWSASGNPSDAARAGLQGAELSQQTGRVRAAQCTWAIDAMPEPAIRGVANGVPDRVDRLKSLGNAVLPQCAEVVGWVVRELILARRQQPKPTVQASSNPAADLPVRALGQVRDDADQPPPVIVDP